MVALKDKIPADAEARREGRRGTNPADRCCADGAAGRLEAEIRFVVEGRQRVEERLLTLKENTAQWATRKQDALAEIERLVRAAAPFPSPPGFGRVQYVDTWLWDRSGRFQLDTLSEGQL
eukprot:gene18917-26788_t